MTIDPRETLIDLLPAGEWADIHILNHPIGLMAGKNWAVLANAKWLRGGEKKAFIKFILAAESGAGSSTLMFTEPSRLRKIHERLLRIRSLGVAVPMVPLIEIRLAPSGLLIAMEKVKPLRELIDSGKAYDLSVRILNDLDPEAADADHWLHFDIDPMNIGVLTSGRCVLIDVESMYLEEADHYQVSVPAWKWPRAPRLLIDLVQINLATGAGAIDRDVAVKKISFEVALAAAECILGPLKSIRGELDHALLSSWISNADPSDPAVEFWKREIGRAIDSGSVRPLKELSNELCKLLEGGTGLLHAPLANPSLPAEPLSAAASAQPYVSAPIAEVAASDWSKEWELLEPVAGALRAGKLDLAGIVEYRKALSQLSKRHPNQREIWNELLFVVISYEKDAGAALQYANRAHENLPGDQELDRWRNIVGVWAGEQRNERK